MFLKKVVSHDHLCHKKLLGGTLAIIGKVVTLLDQPSAVEKLELNLPFQFLHRPVCKTLPEAQQTRTIKSETWLISATNTTLCTFLSPYLSTTISTIYTVANMITSINTPCNSCATFPTPLVTSPPIMCISLLISCSTLWSPQSTLLHTLSTLCLKRGWRRGTSLAGCRANTEAGTGGGHRDHQLHQS